jgi:hypothetical protein
MWEENNSALLDVLVLDEREEGVDPGDNII